MSPLERISRLIYIGCDPKLDRETNRRVVAVNIFVVFGVFLTVSYGINSILINNTVVGYFLLGIGFLFLVARSRYSALLPLQKQPVPMGILFISLTLLMTFLIIDGGINNTGPLWVFVLPPVLFFFTGFKVGSFLIWGYVALMSLLFFYPGDGLVQADYPIEFEVRLLSSFVATILFFSVYEYMREKNLQYIDKLRKKSDYLAMHDALTGLCNRRAAHEYMLAEQIKSNSSRLSLIMCDVDHFKNCNDRYGHKCGDNILTAVSQFLKNGVRKGDLVARWGGEEFLIILPDTCSEDAIKVAEAIRSKLEQTPINACNAQIRVTASFGVSEINGQVSTDDALLLADKSLYIAKQNGRNQVVG